MLSSNPEESLTLEEAQDLQVCRAIKNVYTGAICTIVDKKIPVNKTESMVGDTLYEVRKTGTEGCGAPSFIISAPVLFNLYYYALSEKGTRYCIACVNYENELDEKLSKNEEEEKMKNVVISELKVHQRLLVVKDGEVKGVKVNAGDVVCVKKVYKDGRKFSAYLMSKQGDKLYANHDTVLTAIGIALSNEFFSTDIDTETEEKVEKAVLKQEVLDLKIDADKIEKKPGKPKNIEINVSMYKLKFKKIYKAFRNQNATIVILIDGIKGVSKCNPEYDEYNEYLGVTLSYARAILKQENRNFKEFSKILSDKYRELNKIKKDRNFEHNEIVKYVEKTIDETINRTNK